MTRYIAFLRGINVGGNNLIKMTDLCKIFETAGFAKVKSFIQSGNVLFESPEKDSTILRQKIEHHLEKFFGKTITVILRSHKEITDIVALNPFKDQDWGQDPELNNKYVCFMDRRPDVTLSLPIKIEKEGLVLINITGSDAFLISLPVKGHYGFPNNFIEKEFNLLSTARNWTTVCKIVSL